MKGEKRADNGREILGQISVFDLLNMYETPEIPPEAQKKGVKGWIIEGSGVFLRENGFDHDWRGVCTRPVIMLTDTKRDKDGVWRQDVRTTKGPVHGWYGPYHRIFAIRPSWNDCLKFAAETRSRGDPEEVGYYEIIGDWSGAKYEY